MASSSMSLRQAIGGAALLDRAPVTRLAQNAAVCREPSRARTGSLACRSAVTGIDSDPASFDAVHHQSLDQEWLRLGLSIAPDGGCSRLDEEWLRLGLSFPPSAVSGSAADLDAVWLQLGLTVTDSEPIVITPEGAMTVSEAVAVKESRALAPEAPPTVVEVDPSSYFKEDLRPIVLFDGACNFCSKWTTFLLDHDPLGNLRFASMQSEAGQSLLLRAGMKESDISEIVLATHKRSYIGAEAILHIFSRLALPFPIIAAVGSVTPAALNTQVYKLVSKYRHRFGGPQACRLFDPRFNERFVS